jgi:Domain of unknown function (DUF4384)
MGIPLIRHTLFVVVLLVQATAWAQVKKVTNAFGVALIANITPEQARSKALDEAKVDALRKAGVEEWIQSFDYLDKKEEHNQFSEFFHSVTSVQTMGNVTSWEVVKEQKKLEGNNLLYEVFIDAEVRVYKTKTDPGFQIRISGISPVYKNEDKLTFDVLANREGYLSVYIIDHQSTVSRLFPNDQEKQYQLKAGLRYPFPFSPHFDYEVYTELKEEQNYIFFLFTRQEIPFSGKIFNEFIEYVYGIEPHERFLFMEKIRIVKP